MKCYKVLYRDWNNRLWSIGKSFNHPHDLVIEYVPGKKTVAPEGTRLFVFDNYDNALCFVERSHPTYDDGVEIWEVSATKVIDIHQVAMVLFNPTYKQSLCCLVHSYWYRLLNELPVKAAVVPAPIGTLACASVILKRMVS